MSRRLRYFREHVPSGCQTLRLSRQAEASSLLIPILESVTEPLDKLLAAAAFSTQRATVFTTGSCVRNAIEPYTGVSCHLR